MIQPKENAARSGGGDEDLLTLYEEVRRQARELNGAVASLGQRIRAAHRQERAVRGELDTARGVLAKLQKIAA